MLLQMSAILDELNNEQLAAVKCVDGPVLIVAGAGSGKTRVLTSRIAYTIENGADPSRILALTFTKKAATEMKERIAVMIGERKARRIYMGTFHSVFVRFLREYADILGYPASFTIYDTSDSISAIKTCIKQLSFDDKVYKPKDVLSRISKAKNALITASSYSKNQKALADDRVAKRPLLHEIYTLYDRTLRLAGVMDFDDILLNMNILLKKSESALWDIAGRFDYILVDEYQDTNFSQYRILRELTKLNPKHNICVVGDDSQSIYAFRGAEIGNILNFTKDLPEAKTFRLERNYRSTANIVNAANSLIARNESRIPKTCVAVGEKGEKIRLMRAYTAEEEAILIASSIISRMRDTHSEYKDFAILYRTNSQSRALEEALRKRNLPYMIYSGNSFFERMEVKDVMAYFKLVVNLNDDESFKRVVNKPARGIGGTSLAALEAAAKENQCSLFKAAYCGNLEKFGLRSAGHKKILEFCDLLKTLSERAAKEDAEAVARAIALDTGIYRLFKEDTSIEGQSRTSNVEELLDSVATFRDDRDGEYVEQLIEEGEINDASEVSSIDCPRVLLMDFLEDISLLSNVDVADDEEGSNKIALMTAHSAKGLEFPYVYVAGMEENLFPSGGMLASEKDIEEERRLFYVAITRAKTALVLTFSTTRMRNGKHESNAPSRFLREIAPQYIENPLKKEDLHAHTIEDEDDPGYTRGFRFGGSGSSSSRGSVPQGSASRGGGASHGSFEYRHGGTFSSAAPSRTTTSASITREDIKNRPLPPAIENFVPDTMDKFKVGDVIEHNRFGKGKILEITGRIPELKAKIVFDKYGEKILLLKFAKIRLFPL